MPGVTSLGSANGRGKTELAARWRVEDLGDYVTTVDVAADGRRCAVGTGDGAVSILGMEAGDVQSRVAAHANGVFEARFPPDGQLFASCGQDADAKIFSLRGELLHTLPGGSSWVEHVAWSPLGDRIATASGRKVRVWSREGQPFAETEALPSTVAAVAWSRTGEQLAAVAYGGVHVWTAGIGAKARHLPWKGSLVSLAWSPDAKVIACGSQDCSVHFWRLTTGSDSQMSGYPFKPKALAWDSQSKLLATSGDATVTVWDFAGRGPEGSTPIQLQGHKTVCTCLAFSPRKCVLASGSQDGSVLLWEPRRGNKPLRYGFLEGEVTGLAWAPDSEALVASDAEGNVVCWKGL